MLQEQQPVSTPLHLQPGDVHHYRGFEIYLSDVSRRLVCSYFVTGLKRYCRDIAHGEELIDAYYTAQALPREPGSMRVLAADVRVTNSMSAHESRRRSEQARGQKRQEGKFAPERHEQIEQQQMTQTVKREGLSDDTPAGALMLPVYSIGGEEGFYLPGDEGECLTREDARAVTGKDNEESSVTGVDPALELGLRTQARLLALGVAPLTAMSVAYGVTRDLDQLLIDNGLEEQVTAVRIADHVDGRWVPRHEARAAWADRPLWEEEEGEGPHEQLEQQQAQVAVALPTTPLPLSSCLVTEEDLGYEPFSAEDIAQNIERGDELSGDIYQIGPKPSLMDCAFVLGNLSGIGTQLLLELGKRTLENEQLRAELARVQPAPQVRKPRSIDHVTA